jgi:hypothetical protein
VPPAPFLTSTRTEFKRVLRRHFVFRRFRKIVKSDCDRCHVGPHGTARLPLNGFSWDLKCIFRKSIGEIQVSLTYYKNNGHFTWKSLCNNMVHRERYRWKFNTAHALCIPDKRGYRYAMRMCNIYCFSTTTVITRTRLKEPHIACLALLSGAYRHFQT